MNSMKNALRTWTKEDLEFLKRFLDTCMTCVDVGAGHGLDAVVTGRQVGPAGRVIVSEPSLRACPDIRNYLAVPSERTVSPTSTDWTL